MAAIVREPNGPLRRLSLASTRGSGGSTLRPDLARRPGLGKADITARSLTLRLLAAFGVCGAGLLSFAVGAGAHSQLEETTPKQGAVLAEAPAEIRLRFNESVSSDAGAIRVLDSRGRSVEPGPSRSAGDTEVAASLASLGTGQYVVGWKAVSADGHPINGAFVFTIGSPSSSGSVKGLIESVLDQQGGSRAVSLVFAAVRWIAFAATAVVVGSAVLCLVAAAGLGPVDGFRSPTRRAAWIGAVSAAGGFLLQGVYSGGRPLTDAIRPTAWGDALDITGGPLWLVRAALFAAVIVASGGSRVVPRTVGLVVSAGLCAAIAGSGHAVSGPWPLGAFALDVVHLAATGVWIGGLFLVVTTLWSRRDRAADADLRPLVDRFSTVALISVGAVTATGVAQAFRQVGELSQITSTSYGKLLIAKVVLVGLMVSMGWYGRIVLRGVVGGEALEYLRRSVLGEAALAVVILAVTSFLSTTVPAREQIAQPFDRTVVDDAQFVNVTVSPARVGANELHVTVTPTATGTGTPDPITEVTVELVLPERDLGPVTVTMVPIAPNHVTADDAVFPVAGTWEVRVSVRYGEFTTHSTTASVVIR